jgi:L-asparaginase
MSAFTIPNAGVPVATTLITWGGTITMVPAPKGDNTLVPGDAGHVVALVDELTSASSAIQVTTHVEGPTSDSAEADRTSLYELVAAVRAAASVGPVLITHGTDTLSFAAAILAASLNPAWPVILTGATSPLYTEGSDAAVNIGAALAGANELPPGVWVVFATRDQTRAVVLQGGYAVKRSDQPGDFQDIRDEPFGYIVNGILLAQGMIRTQEVLPDRSTGPVRVEVIWPGWTSAGQPLIGANATIVYVLYPCATAPAAVLNSMTAELANGHRVLATTFAGTGSSTYPSTIRLSRLGVERSTLPLELVLAALLRPTEPSSPPPLPVAPSR